MEDGEYQHNALQSLVFAIQNPKAEQAQEMIDKAQKAIKANPDNGLARQLYEKFKEGMWQMCL